VQGRPNDSKNGKIQTLHGFNFHVAHDVWQHSDEPNNKEKYDHAENDDFHHGSPLWPFILATKANHRPSGMHIQTKAYAARLLTVATNTAAAG
jgi:hypothetical protein